MFKIYMDMQIKFIKKYAKHLHTDTNTASLKFVKVGLAKKFHSLYREGKGF